MNHVAHILASVFLCGLWLPVWLIIAATHEPSWHCAFCGFHDQQRYLADPALRQREQVEADRKNALAAARLAEMPRETKADRANYFFALYKVPILITTGVAGLVFIFVLVAIFNTPQTTTSTTARQTLYPTPYPSSTKSPFPSPSNRAANIPQVPRRAKVASTIMPASLRATPDGEIVDTIPEGTTVDVILQQGPWFKIKYGGAVGWVHGNFIKLGTAQN